MIRRFLLIAILLVSLLALSVPFAFAQDGSITTMFAANNSFAGNMFDVTATTTLTITAFDVNLDPAGGSSDIAIYYKPGTYVGFESDAGAWTLLGSDTVTPAGLDNPTRVEVGGLTIPAGETYGLYVDLATYPSASMQYTNGSNTFSNADITLTLGIGRGNPAFLGTIFNPRTWNGTIYYTLGEGGEPPPPPSGCFLSIPAGSVVGDLPFETQVYYEPGNASPGIFLNPGTYIVTGQDASETYYQIMLACQFVWVRKDAMQPSYQPPQNGAALPTTIIGGEISTGGGAPAGSDEAGG